MTLWTRIREIGGNMNVRKPPRVAHPHVSKPLPPTIKAANAAINATAPIPVGNAVTLPPVTHRKTSQAGIDLMHQFEGLHKLRHDGKVEAYLCPAKVWTIGWGSTGKDPFNGGAIKGGTVWTREQCDMRFEQHLATFEAGVRDGLAGKPASQAQFDAMVCLAYNIGVGAFQRSTVLRKHNAGDFDGAAKAFLMWTKAGGKVLKGLVRRREAEAALYRGAA
jgi:GH24 family phage-related lysozyme (muramidase)